MYVEIIFYEVSPFFFIIVDRYLELNLGVF